MYIKIDSLRFTQGLYDKNESKNRCEFQIFYILVTIRACNFVLFKIRGALITEETSRVFFFFIHSESIMTDDSWK